MQTISGREIFRLVGAGLGAGLLCAVRPVAGQAVPAPLTLRAAAAATELPLNAWGPYSRLHSGPCYLADRLLGQLFVFPIVIGQRRDEVVQRQVKTPEGRTRLVSERVALERRMTGLSPVAAFDDDRPAKSDVASNRRARITAANADGLLWRAEATFAPAEVTQEVAPQRDPGGKTLPIAPWGAGAATIDFFPAFAEPSADGLLIVVTLTNRSKAPQTYYVDLLGGLNSVSETFPLKELAIIPDFNGDGVVVRHVRSQQMFALAANIAPYPIRFYHVRDAYFLPDATMEPRTTNGVARPVGLMNARKEADNKKEGASNGPRPADADPPPDKNAADTTGEWGLARMDDIVVEPEQSVTVYLSVGVGRSIDGARDSAQSLLGLVEDATPIGKPQRIGLYSQALAAHQKARYSSGNAAIDRLMSQSLANIPSVLTRRVGAPSRQETRGQVGGLYRAEPGGLIALGWMRYRPDWTAAQLNAYFLTRSDPEAPFTRPQAVPPTNLFALWELWERTHDREMLARFYPFARRRYRELIAAGKIEGKDALYAWPAEISAGPFTPEPPKINDPKAKPTEGRYFSPDYTAYVVRAARLMRQLAEHARQPEAEQHGYEQDAENAARALNATLWDAKRSVYTTQPVSAAVKDAPPPPANSLLEALPLVAGADALPSDRRAALLAALTDPARFWSDAGLRTLSRSAPNYRPDLNFGGAISFGLNWQLWKALLDLGETETARKLAEALLTAYEKAQAASNTCPEWLNGDTGTAGGVDDYSGDACALIALYAAYHTPGIVSSGWDTDILDQRYDAAADTLRVVFRSSAKGAKGTLLCALGKPNGKYTLSGALTTTLTADANGLLTLTVPQDSTTFTLDIAPAK